MATSTAKPRTRRARAPRATRNGRPRTQQTPYLSPEERAAHGKALRAEAPRKSHGEWLPATDRPDPIDLLQQQAASRVPELVPIRYGRMAASPFAFYRGAAYVMASDLAGTPSSGVRVQLCGDAHLSNFGGFASPERELLFDLNDFDETLPGPWEWDAKRLAASLNVAARQNGFPVAKKHEIVEAAVREYREAMHRFAGMTTLDIWYARVDVGMLQALIETEGKGRQARQFGKVIAKARRKDSTRAFEKLAARVNGDVRIVADPPLIVPVDDLLSATEARRFKRELGGVLDSYRESLPIDRCRLLDRFRYADLAHKVVGVGSVGTRAWVLLMLGRDSGDPLFLQAKEAQRSVLEPFVGKSEFDNQGHRVVEGQRLMQAASDIFLGWIRVTGLDGKRRDFYIRQLWDWKSSADIETMNAKGMALYGRLCGATLARAHARSGDAIAIASYLGNGNAFDRAIVAFAEVYADQNELDHAALVSAIDRGTVEAESGI
ncbi:MAG: DUF2252 domain-containing protein [Gaiellaceae bacterium]